jgi:hypothetical protein
MRPFEKDVQFKREINPTNLTARAVSRMEIDGRLALGIQAK